MRKRINTLDASFIISGLGSGEHKEAIEDVREVLTKMCDGYVDMFNVRLRPVEYPEELFYEIARVAKENKKYFNFLYA